MLDRCFPEPGLDKSRIRASFGRAASNYDDWAGLQRRIGDRLIEFLPFLSASNASILDLGAGTGYCSRRLQGPDCNILNLDLALPMLVKARSLEDQQAQYICGDAESLPIKNRCLDIVFSNLVLQWCGRLDQVFKEVRRVLKPGGIFVFSTFGPATLSELRDAWERVDFGAHVHEFSGGPAIRAAISRSGLEIHGLEREMLHVEYKDVMELMRELKGIGAHNIALERPRTLTGKDKVGRMIAEYRKLRPDRKISATFELILGRCERSHGPNVDC